MKWKNRLKTTLAESAEREKKEKCLDKALTITDKTHSIGVSSVFVSDKLRDFSEKTSKTILPPKCSNCDLEMNLIENNTLWFCPIGCESRKAV